MHDNDDSRRWRIGDLAQATGLTVRALHHYEDLGLLAPSRTDGNHRLYDEDDIQRLYRIRALRELGLTLAEIRGTLLGRGGKLGDVLRAHLAQAEAELRRLTDLRDRLQRVCARDDVPVDDLLGAIEAMSRVAEHAERQRASGRAPADTEARWRALGEGLRACMDRGEPPSSPRARELALRAHDAIRAFAEHDPATLDALALLRRIDAPTGLAGWDPPLTRYLDDALRALEDPC